MREFVDRPLPLDVAGTGFTVLDRVYADGALTDEALGGSCANVLISLAMLGHNVAPVLRLGADAEGARLVEEFLRAGAVVEFISRMADLLSPILAEKIDRSTASHEFSFRCPVTDSEFPRYEPITKAEVDRARGAVGSCKIFFADRLSEEILDAMHIASQAGALVVFEPSAIEDDVLFSDALEVSAVLKVSSERIDLSTASNALAMPPIQIVTHGKNGLEVSHQGSTVWCPAIDAPEFRDACGSGDMVTVGLLDSLISREKSDREYLFDDVLKGVRAGQRLAAENCAFESARGLFRTCGPARARSLLNDLEI
ncbi:PfkB family carbohydrate kinase [Oceanicola sp. 22II-s10i]|uniref:PfkB family carbohydrate kinase n=1 Tax=Oceanicola sp. 22II-s10i TaxID=1317116 RepID=UPI001C3D5D02|nr:PfkB family carbohydrate kinase [Oceanicola sp. 22II-s10i]